MIAIVRRILSRSISKHAPRSPFSSSLSLNFSSIPRGTELGFNPAVFDTLRHKYQFPPELATRVASELRRVKPPEKVDSVLSFLKQNGFSRSDLEKAVKYRPKILVSNVEDFIKPKFNFFREMGFSSKDISRIISRSPSILGLSLNNNIIPTMSLLKSLLGSNESMANVVRRSRLYLTMNLGSSVVPNVEFLKSCGVPMDRIRMILESFPGVFLSKPIVMRKCAEKAMEMGFDASSRNFVYAVSTIGTFTNKQWELKLQAFRKSGFSDSDIATMFRKAPQSLQVSVEKMEELKDAVLATGKYDLSSIVNCPKLFYYSFEKRLKPRFEILRVLESRNLIGCWPCLGAICQSTDDQFFKRFIKPHLDKMGDLYITKRNKGDKLLCYSDKISKGKE